MLQLPDDFREFLSILNAESVEYLVVGGWALGVHGYVRATGDMDMIKTDGVDLPFLGYADLVRNKRSSGRIRDLADLEGLGEAPEAGA